jgi:hypothetical protein
MQRSASVSLTDEAVAHPDPLELRVADVREHTFAPAQDLHQEIHRATGGAPAGSVDGRVQLALIVSGERVEPRLLGTGEA